MSRHVPLYEWAAEVATHFPRLSKPQAYVLAFWSFGIVLAHRCTLPAVANVLTPLLQQPFNTIRQRLREWYKGASEKAGAHRRELDVTSCFAPLLAWILKDWPCPRVALALDATTLGDRLVVLSLGLVYRGTAIPVAWKILPGNQRHAWKTEWLKLLGWFADQVAPTWTVIVLTDRGLYARWLFQAIVALGWHPIMRVTRMGKFLPEGWTKAREFGWFIPKVGSTWQGRGIAFPRKPERRLACTLLACWAEGHEGGWYVLTDLPPEVADAAWYGLRMWIERGFEQFKSMGWHWQKTRIAVPERVSRMWLAIALATFWVVAAGGKRDHDEGSQETTPHLPTINVRKGHTARPKAQRLVSVLNQGIAAILARLMKGHALKPKKWYPEPWPELEVISQDQEHDHNAK
jgi:hypothetical protein